MTVLWALPRLPPVYASPAHDGNRRDTARQKQTSNAERGNGSDGAKTSIGGLAGRPPYRHLAQHSKPTVINSIYSVLGRKHDHLTYCYKKRCSTDLENRNDVGNLDEAMKVTNHILHSPRILEIVTFSSAL